MLANSINMFSHIVGVLVHFADCDMNVALCTYNVLVHLLYSP